MSTGPDICLLYARPNGQIVGLLHSILSKSYKVWWDRDIHSGDYRTEIENQLRRTSCVIPIWCRISRSDPDVVDEATFARDQRKALLPIRLESVTPPLGFGSLHTVDLTGWNGDETDPRLLELLRNIQSAIGFRATRLAREPHLAGPKGQLALPVFFPSVSSHETQLSPEAAVQALELFQAEVGLVSAYDTIKGGKSALVERLEACRRNGTVVLLDSGNYEAYRKRDRDWTVEKLWEAFARTPHDFAFCFDDLTPPAQAEAAAKSVIEAVNRDRQHTDKPILPIVHAPRDETTSPRFEMVPEIMTLVTRALRPEMIAIPERELGDGLLTRARTVYAIRSALNELGFYQPLHLLGVGNPLSIAIFAAAGADSFDGLEWCRTVVDQESGLLYHHQQYDFFRYQTLLSQSAVVQSAADDPATSFVAKMAFHNLDFFAAWMAEIRRHTAAETLDRFLVRKLPHGAFDDLANALPEVFR
jgi:queuine/archaeosine tRNA-ribosyltransferase